MAQQTKVERVSNGDRTESDAGSKTGAVLVVGGGIAGIQASLDLADGGYNLTARKQEVSPLLENDLADFRLNKDKLELKKS